MSSSGSCESRHAVKGVFAALFFYKESFISEEQLDQWI
jgi:hypothetical protein